MKFNFTFIAEIAIGTALASMIAPLFQKFWNGIFHQNWDDSYDKE